MKQRVRDLVEQGDKLFARRQNLVAFWQEVAENFYPERADFTTTRTMGQDFAAHLMSGYPVLVRRDLANNLSAMLRPKGETWARLRTDSEALNNDRVARSWLDWASERQHRLMYDRRAQFVRATARGDHDFAAFGQCIILPEMRRERDGILYRCFHLRDTVWCETSEHVIDTVHRNWSVEARELVHLFPDTVAAAVKTCLKDEPYRTIKCRHIVMPADQYEPARDGERKTYRFPFRSIYVEIENDTILEEIGVPANDYVIPRWGIWPDTQYGMSPAVVVALPDARMLQQVGLTLLEAGQKAVDPPWKAVGEVIGSGVNMQAGGVTFVDPDYDETTGKALEQFPIDTRGLNFGVAVQAKCEAMIAEAFYLNKITLPDTSKDMTAYEVQKRVEQYIRQALPLFEPMESEYNGGLCDKTFEIGMRLGWFGSAHDIPAVLRGRDVRFQFDSPLQAASERAKATTFAEAQQLLAAAINFDPTARHHFRPAKAFRDALMGIGAPIDWMADEGEAEAAITAEREQQARAAQVQNMLDAGGAVADVAERAGRAAQEVNAAGGAA